jgi:hypothetical protein
MEQISTSNIIDFVESFKQKYRLIEKTKICETKQAFETLFGGFRPIYTNYKKEIKQNSPYYNVFGVLGLIGKELYHSRFLADLLNVKGAHSQGNLFYNAFLMQIEIDKEIFKVEQQNFWAFDIQCEYTIEKDRRIDILIQYNDGRKKFAIGIENKIWAADQPKQLEDYNTFLKEQFGENYLLLYLTIDGKEPSISNPNIELEKQFFSITSGTYNDIIYQKLLLLSHRNHIQMMLKQAISEIQSPILTPILINYQHILSIL